MILYTNGGLAEDAFTMMLPLLAQVLTVVEIELICTWLKLSRGKTNKSNNTILKWFVNNLVKLKFFNLLKRTNCGLITAGWITGYSMPVTRKFFIQAGMAVNYINWNWLIYYL